MSNRTRLALANSEAFAGALSPAEFAVLATVLATLSLVTVSGNALVMLSFFLDRSLRTHTNSFLLSLAASDMLIGAISMPFFSQYLLKGQWTLGRVLCDLWLGQDYMCSTASCLNLVVIGLDRYFSVTKPLRYRARRTGRQVAVMIGGVWVISFLIWPPWIWTWQYIDGRRTVPDDDCYVQFLETNFYLTMVTSALDYYLPLAVMLLLYYGIWKETRKRERYLATMETERLGGLADDDRSHPKRVSRMDCGNTTEKFIGEDPSQSAGISSDPVLLPLRFNADDKADFTQNEPYSSVKDIVVSDLDEMASSRTKDVPLVDISFNQTSRKRSGTLRGDHKAARVLTAILLAFIVTTTPYNVIVIVKNLDATHSLVPDTVWYFFYFLFYVNSTLNPVCYALANRNFKRTYWKILTCSWSTRKMSVNRSLQQSRMSTTSV